MQMLTLIKKFDMINAWSLAGSFLDGTLDDEYPIMTDNAITPQESDEYDPPESTPMGIENPKVTCKYGEDEILNMAKDYITGTYRGHYTTKGSNIQTLDLIESVGDAEAFCRSNAIKYLSRYDKKGFPKKDILKAVHYCVLLYHFTSKPVDIIEPYETF